MRILYRPLAGGPNSHYIDSSRIYKSPTLAALASRYDISIGLLTLSWMAQRHIIAIPHMSSAGRMTENLRTVRLTDEEVDKINNLATADGGKPERLMDSVPFAWFDNVIPGKKTLHGWTVQDLGWEDDEGNWLI